MAALLVGLGSTAFAQKTATAPATASILSDLTITLDATQNAINFGTVSASTPGEIVLDANGTANAHTGTVTNVARFDLAGAAAAEVTVGYDATVTLTETVDGVATMVMTPEVVGAATDALQASAEAITIAEPGINLVLNAVSEVGEYFIWVGGSIPQLSGKATGIYSGVFNINVEYN